MNKAVNVNKEVLQFALNRHAEIIEAVPIIRQDVDCNDVLVVYIVPATLSLSTATCFTLNDLLSDFQLDESYFAGDLSALKEVLQTPTPAQIVLINAVPRKQDGSVDEDALTAMPVMEKGLMENWSTAIQAIAGIEKLAVIDVLTHHKTNYLHRGDVINFAMPGISSSATVSDSTETGASNSTAPQSEVSTPVLKSTVWAEVHAPGLHIPGLADVDVLTDRLDKHYALNLANTLYRAAKISPDKGIGYIDDVGKKCFQTYPQLLENAQLTLSGLQTHGLKAGDKVLLQCADNQDFLTAFWACILGGLVPVPMPIAPAYTIDNAVVQKLINTWQMLDQPIIVCSDSLLAAFVLLSESSPLNDQHIVSVDSLRNSGSTDTKNINIETAPQELALLLLTSGSTGTPKAVMHTHQTLINRSAATSEFNHFTRDDVSLNWMPLDHVGGIVMFHLRDVYNACSQVQVATSWILEQPLRWLDTIDAERVNVTWAPNFAFALLIDMGAEISTRSWDLSCMRFLLNGGESVVAQTASRFLQLLKQHSLPADSMHPAWGMSETASGVCYSHAFSVDSGVDSHNVVEVGAPIANTSLRIVDENNQLLCEGEKGNLQIRGASITPGYFLNPEANQQAFTDDGWFDTGDAGVLNDGRLTITSRIKDEIIINGINYPATDLEVITESVDGVKVSYTAACAVRQENSDTDALAIFFCPAENNNELLVTVLQSIQSNLLSSVGIKPDFIVPLTTQQVPKTNIGKIQRTLLKQQFEQGEFEENLKQSERLLGTNVIPDWFYKKNWYPKDLHVDKNSQHEVSINPDKRYLVFRDAGEFTNTLCERLNLSGAQVVVVSSADVYSCMDDSRYAINPSEISHYERLMNDLQYAGFEPDIIIHCWTYAEAVEVKQLDTLRQAQYSGMYSLLLILQSLAAIKSVEKQVALYVVSSDVQQHLSEERSLNPHATMLGLLKTAPYEFNWLTTQHIDFSFCRSVSQLAVQVDSLFDEITCQSSEDEIVYRFDKGEDRQDNHLQRYGWQLSADIFQADNLQSCPIKQGGIILISGGLGGIGAYLARFLIKQFDAKLILLGRSVLPERDKWLELQQQEGTLAERITEYLAIEATTGEFIYRAADVTDTEALQQIVADAEKHWDDELNGVFHLAVGGEMGTRWQDGSAHTIAAENVSSFEQMFATKVYASWDLAALVSQRESTFMVSFGSVIGVFGAAQYASYASAHTMLSQLTYHFNQAMPGRFYQFDWAVWENIGLSRQEPKFAIDYYRSIGYSQIPANTGMDSLIAGLCQREAELIIGLDSDKWPIRKHLPFESQPLQRIVACFTANGQITDLESSLNLPATHSDVYDRFYVQTQCELMQFESLPETAEGVPDISALQTTIENDGTDEDVMPESEMEKQIAEYWCEVLNISSPGMHNSFFQLGGNSLNAMQLISRLKQRFNIHLDMRDLFDAATISDMTDFIENRLDQSKQNETQSKIHVDNNHAHQMETQDMNDQELLANIDQLSEEQIAELLSTMQPDGKA